ncbi:MAG: hypothetical protein U1A78_07685 [Polyangia bacterium]
MMYYNCEHCKKPIKKPYPSKKYCSVNCRENNRKERVEEQELAFWNSLQPLVIPLDAPRELWEMAEAVRAAHLIRNMAPDGAVGYRVGCRRVGAETYTVHWFPTEQQRQTRLFLLNPPEAPMEIPCPAEYAVAYFGAIGNLLEPPRFKLTLRARAIGILWSEGDRKLLLQRALR